MDNGYWVKFNIHRTPKNNHIPHGIKYSLTLHDRYNRRIIGYDNAHGIKPPKKKKFSGSRLVWDHKHQKSAVHPYEFESAYQLLEDFWNDSAKVNVINLRDELQMTSVKIPLNPPLQRGTCRCTAWVGKDCLGDWS